MIEDDTDYVLDHQVGYLMRLANQRHALIFQDMAPDSLTPTQFSAMIRIDEQGVCSQNQLGRLAAMDVATIKGVVDRLRDKALVQSRPDPTDKRRTILSLSPKGKEMVDGLKRTGLEITEATLEPLTQSEREAFVKMLKKMT